MGRGRARWFAVAGGLALVVGVVAVVVTGGSDAVLPSIGVADGSSPGETEQPPGETERLDCRRLDHPCSWAEADPDARDRSQELLERVGEAQLDGATGEDIVAMLEDVPEVAEVDSTPAAITFRVEGDQPVHVFTPLAARLPDDVEPDGEIARPRAAHVEVPAPALVPAADRTIRPAASPAVGGSPPRVHDVVTAEPVVFEPAGQAGHGNDPNGKRAIIVEPVGGMSANWSGDALVQELRDTEQYTTVDHVVEGQVDFSTMEGLDAYDVVHISSHGWQDGVIGQPIRPYYEVDEAGKGSLKDGVEIPVGVTRGTSYGVKIFAYTTDFFREAYPGGLQDTIVFADWCQSAKDPAMARALAGPTSSFFGWSESVGVGFAARAAARFWTYVADDGVDTGTAKVQLAEEGLATVPSDDSWFAAVEDLVACGTGECRTSEPARLVDRGADLRARDVVTTLDGNMDRVAAGTTLEWSGVKDDGTPDVLDELTLLVEGVEHGREGEVTLELLLDGQAFPEVLNLADASELATGPRWSGWELNVTDVEMPFDVTDDVLAPAELDWEVRVRDGSPGHSAHIATPVQLEGSGIELLHPETLARLGDGDVVQVDGTEGDGEPDDVDIVFEVTGIDPDDVEEYEVVVTVLGEPMAFPRERTHELADLEQVDEGTYRHRETWTLDGDVTDDTDQLTVDVQLLRRGNDEAEHEATVKLEGDEPSGCSFDISWSAEGSKVLGEDNRGPGTESPLSGNDPDPWPTVVETEDVSTMASEHRSGEGALLRIPSVSDEDAYGVMVNALEGYGAPPTDGAPYFHWWLRLGGHVPPGATGTFTVPYAEGGSGSGMELMVTDGAGYNGPVDVELTINDVYRSDLDGMLHIRRLQGTFEAASTEPGRSATVRGAFSFDWDSC